MKESRFGVCICVFFVYHMHLTLRSNVKTAPIPGTIFTLHSRNGIRTIVRLPV